MSELVVIAYPEAGRAEEVMAALLQLRKQAALDLEDVVVVSKDENERIKLRQSEHLGRKGAVAGGAIGLIAGMLFLGPVVGLGVGALVGGITNRLRDVGVSDDFVRQVSAQLKPGSSALALLMHSSDSGALFPELAREGAVVLHTTLAPDAEAQLQTALDGQPAGSTEDASAESARDADAG
jgi:uncharacterized membrane protein